MRGAPIRAVPVLASVVCDGEAIGAAAHYADVTHLKKNTYNDKMNVITNRKKGLANHRNVYYKDFNDKIFGPMPGEIVRHWYDHNLISGNLLISLGATDHEGQGKSFCWTTLNEYFSKL